ncbi:S24 family peptidase [Sedimenticola selenatireducens]|uniref:Peptidase S24 n=1 Tax=Sedimenticola selenatireducens TaxID=191960 RepID=A0A2N6CV50_9GAMM|nr:S24 family peptidase [Sedimenticola selenatireducens]PLX61082.1 MAG: peptidase S24 [Sedimenticola selenatireducens]
MKRKHEQIRLQNLELLITEAGSAVKLARLVGTNSSYLSQLRNQMPTKKGTPRRVGDNLAVKLEHGMEKPVGWMDEPHQESPRQPPAATPETNAEPGPDIRGLRPLISWVQAGEWSKISECCYFPPYESELLPCPLTCSDETFVLRVRGSSMEPRFHEGDSIFVDPTVAAENGRFVVVQLEEPNEATFKQLVIEGDRQYLKALNPDWPNRIIEVNESATICGVVIFKGEAV